MALRQAWLPVTAALGGLTTRGWIADDVRERPRCQMVLRVRRCRPAAKSEHVLCANFELLAGVAILVLLSAPCRTYAFVSAVCSAP